MSSQTPRVVSVAKTMRINLQNGKLGQRPSNSYSKFVCFSKLFFVVTDLSKSFVRLKTFLSQ